jgi:hypothetical protein
MTLCPRGERWPILPSNMQINTHELNSGANIQEFNGVVHSMVSDILRICRPSLQKNLGQSQWGFIRVS